MNCVGTWTVYHRRLLFEMSWTDAEYGKVMRTKLGGSVSQVRNRFIWPTWLVTREWRRYRWRRPPSRSLRRIRWKIFSDDCLRVQLPRLRSQLRFRKFRWWRSCDSVWWRKRRLASLLRWWRPSLRDWRLRSDRCSRGIWRRCNSLDRDPSGVIGMLWCVSLV